MFRVQQRYLLEITMIGTIQRQSGPHLTGLTTGEQANVYNLLQGRYVILENVENELIHHHCSR
ncbi:hypothetical protein V1478_008561 [Vespula squamosa]|uniref:Uncharacterized protein n=1 Tax=Vespula squamosa TaxID=30214 RepID=A0ABD2ATX6_VESSQ